MEYITVISIVNSLDYQIELININMDFITVIMEEYTIVNLNYLNQVNPFYKIYFIRYLNIIKTDFDTNLKRIPNIYIII